MSNLVKAYENYYQEPNEGNAHSLLESIKNYNFENANQDVEKIKSLLDNVPQSDEDNIFHMLEGKKAQFMMLSSNGSTNPINTNYEFGPHVDYWQNNIESKLRNSKNEPVIDLMKDKIENIEKIYDRKGPVRVMGTSHNLMYPTTHSKQAEWLYKNKHMIYSLVNMNWEPFYKKNFLTNTYFNDQMIDWKTGVNFYTCKEGSKHILPLWVEKDGKHVNLLNLKFLHTNISDQFNIKGFENCKCGKKKCNFDFIPHYKHSIRNKHGEYFYKPNLIESLKGCYHKLQFLQNPQTDVVHIYMNPDGKMNYDDLDLIYAELDKMKLPYHLVANKWFLVGRAKMPNFWRGDTATVKELAVNKPISVF